ncbi:MAG: MFS transporter [Burkholderiales bacterium]|nr:MFS transporter [Burkholderiales bacterium]
MKAVWLSLVLTLAIQVMVSLIVFTPPVLAPEAQADVAVGASAVGIVTSLIYAAAAFAALLSGGLIGRFGPIRVSQFSLALCGLGIGLMASANLALIVLGALVIGLGYGPITPSSSAVLADRVPARLRALIFSLKQTGVPIGGALAGALVPLLIIAFGWRSAALAMALAGVAAMLAVQPWRRGVDSGSRGSDPAATRGLVGPLRLALRHARLREMALASFTYSGMQMCLGSFLVVYLHDRAGLSLPAAGAALSTAMLAGVMGRVFWGVVADNWIAPRRLLGLLGGAMSVCAVLVAMVDASWPMAAVLVLSALYGATAVGWNGVYLSEVARVVPAEQAAAATGGSLAMTYSGVVVLPLLFWVIVSTSGSYAAAFGAVALLTAWRAQYFLRRA